MRLGELKEMFGETGYVDAEDRLSAGEQKEQEAKPTVDTQTPLPAPSTLPQDPASIAKQNLLDRIRATRASVAGTGKLGSDKK